jgi:hypothetical protein
MNTRIITLAAIAVTGMAALASPSHAQLGGALGGSVGGAVGGIGGSANGAGSITRTPSSINGGAATGINGHTSVPNVTTATDPVRQGAAGINSAQAEATRTTGDAARDAAATAENNIARTGTPDVGVSGSANANAAGQSANASGSTSSQGAVDAASATANRGAGTAANTANRASGAAANATNRAANATERAEQQATQQLNRDASANAGASVSGGASTR